MNRYRETFRNRTFHSCRERHQTKDRSIERLCSMNKLQGTARATVTRSNYASGSNSCRIPQERKENEARAWPRTRLREAHTHMRSPDAPAHLFSSQPVIRAWLARSCNVHRVREHIRKRNTRARIAPSFSSLFPLSSRSFSRLCSAARAIRMRNEREQRWRWRKATLARVALRCIYSGGSMRGRWRSERHEKDETRPFHWNGTKPRGNGHSSVGSSESRLSERASTRIDARSNDSLRVLHPETIFILTLLQQREYYTVSLYRDSTLYIYIYIFIIFVDNLWRILAIVPFYNRRLFARVPTILAPNYLIRVRVRDRPYSTTFFLHNGKGGKREEEEEEYVEKLSRMVVGLELARGSGGDIERVEPEGSERWSRCKKKEKRRKNGLVANRGSVLPPRAEKYEA